LKHCPVVLTPIFDDHSGGTVFDNLSGPIFDDVDSGPIVDTSTDDMEDAPWFDIEPIFPRRIAALLLTPNIEPVFPGRVAALLLTPDIKQSDGEVETPAKCSTKCLSNDVEEVIVPWKDGGSQPPVTPDPTPHHMHSVQHLLLK
jgi:hypothetical protein